MFLQSTSKLNTHYISIYIDFIWRDVQENKRLISYF